MRKHDVSPSRERPKITSELPFLKKSRRQAQTVYKWNFSLPPPPSELGFCFRTTEAPRSGADIPYTIYRVPASGLNFLKRRGRHASSPRAIHRACVSSPFSFRTRRAAAPQHKQEQPRHQNSIFGRPANLIVAPPSAASIFQNSACGAWSKPRNPKFNFSRSRKSCVYSAFLPAAGALRVA
ncbi:hypothetical protein C8R43DRAFT_950901 [Mycena crocata]|nr:hypothetical protein C8R43DRAFT_950901 [Mycena crocata]